MFNTPPDTEQIRDKVAFSGAIIIEGKVVHQQDRNCKEKIAAKVGGTVVRNPLGQPHTSEDGH